MPFLLGAAALLLLATGGAKLRTPGPTGDGLAAVGLPRWLARPVGIAEVTVGVAALTWSSWVPAAAVAVLYAGFGAYVVAALRAGSTASCGCSGADDTPPTRLHLVVDGGAAVVGVVAAAAGTPALVHAFDGASGSLLAVACTPLVAGAAWLAITVHPRLQAARRALRTP